MSSKETIQQYISELRQSYNLLVVVEQPQLVDENIAMLVQAQEGAIHNSVLAAAHGLAQHDFPGATRFFHAYYNLVQEFWVQAEDKQFGFLDERRATQLRPAALYILGSFLTRLA